MKNWTRVGTLSTSPLLFKDGYPQNQSLQRNNSWPSKRVKYLSVLKREAANTTSFLRVFSRTPTLSFIAKTKSIGTNASNGLPIIEGQIGNVNGPKRRKDIGVIARDIHCTSILQKSVGTIGSLLLQDMMLTSAMGNASSPWPTTWTPPTMPSYKPWSTPWTPQQFQEPVAYPRSCHPFQCFTSTSTKK